MPKNEKIFDFHIEDIQVWIKKRLGSRVVERQTLRIQVQSEAWLFCFLLHLVAKIYSIWSINILHFKYIFLHFKYIYAGQSCSKIYLKSSIFMLVLQPSKFILHFKYIFTTFTFPFFRVYIKINDVLDCFNMTNLMHLSKLK